MYYQYSKLIGENYAINKSFVIDKNLFNQKYGFLLQEILSDYNIKPCSQFEQYDELVVISNSMDFIDESIGNLGQFKKVRAVIIGGNYKDIALKQFISQISESEFPPSISENRKKIILSKKDVRICSSALSRLLDLIYKIPRLPKRIELHLKHRFGISPLELESMLSSREITIPMSNVIDRDNILSLSLRERCWLTGVSVNSGIVRRETLESDIIRRRSELEGKLIK